LVAKTLQHIIFTDTQ